MAQNPFGQFSPEERAMLRTAINEKLLSGPLKQGQQAKAAKALQLLAEIDQPAEQFVSDPDSQLPAGTRALQAVGASVKGLLYNTPKALLEAMNPTSPGERLLPGPALVLKHLVADPTVAAGTEAYQLAQQGDTLGAVAKAGEAVPLIGPYATARGQQLGRGDIAGTVAGTITDLAVPKVLSKVPAAVRNLKDAPPKVAANFAKAAVKQLKDVKNFSEAAAVAEYGPKPVGTVETARVKARLTKILTDENLTATPPTTFKKITKLLKMDEVNLDNLRQARELIGEELRSTNLLTNESRAFRRSYRALSRELRNLYDAEGRLGDYTRGEAAWSQHMKTFSDKRSPIKKALDAAHAEGGIDTQQVLRSLKTSDPGGPAAVTLERLRRFGISEKLGTEAQQLNNALDRWSALGAYKSDVGSLSRQTGLQHAIAYATSRPSRFPTLRNSIPAAAPTTLSTLKGATREYEAGTPLEAFFARARAGEIGSEVPTKAVRIAQDRAARKSYLERSLETSAPPPPGEIVVPPGTPNTAYMGSRPVLNYELRPFETPAELPRRVVPNPLDTAMYDTLQRWIEERAAQAPPYRVQDYRNVPPQPGELPAVDLPDMPISEMLTGQRPPLAAPMTQLFAPTAPQRLLPAGPGFVRGAENAAEVPKEFFSSFQEPATATPRTLQQYKNLANMLRLRSRNRR